MTGPCVVISTVLIAWDLKDVVTLRVLFGPAIMTVMLSDVHLGVVDAAALPWWFPVTTKEAMTWGNGQMLLAKVVTPVTAVS